MATLYPNPSPLTATTRSRITSHVYHPHTAIISSRLRPVASLTLSPRPNNNKSLLIDPNPSILPDGCDFHHWLVVMDLPQDDGDDDLTREQMIHTYIKTLAMVLGSEEDARQKIYSVSTKHYFAFGALVSEELSYKLKGLPNVRWVLPDSYLDVRNKVYGGEPFINGEAVPYDPKYHAECVTNDARDSNQWNRHGSFDRSRNDERRRDGPPGSFDRSRNYERRREWSSP